MQRHGIADLDALVAALVTSNSRQLLDDTVDAMLNNETYFYREYSVFDEIAATALEQIREINKLRRRLTIWHCGVSTGQEAYSMAMLIAEQGAKRSEEHTSELQSLMRISYAVFCLKKKKQKQ